MVTLEAIALSVISQSLKIVISQRTSIKTFHSVDLILIHVSSEVVPKLCH